MGVGAGLYMCDVVKKSSRSLSHLLMSSCFYYYIHQLVQFLFVITVICISQIINIQSSNSNPIQVFYATHYHFHVQ